MKFFFFGGGGRGGGYINWYLMKEDQRKKFKGHLHIIVKCLSHSYNSLFCFSCSTETIQGPGGPPSDCVGGTKHQSTLWAPSQQPPSHHLVPSEWFQCHLREIWWVEWNPSSLWLRGLGYCVVCCQYLADIFCCLSIIRIIGISILRLR